MPEQPPMLPPKPDDPVTLPELEAEIKRLTEAIDRLMQQKATIASKERKRSRGDDVPNIEEAAELEPRPGHSPSAGGGMTGSQPIDREIAEKINRRARLIIKRNDLIRGGQPPKSD